MNDPLDVLYAKALPGFLNPKDSDPPPPVHDYDWSVWSREELMAVR